MLCTGGTKTCCQPGGIDDPHKNGFHGTKFDFHGEFGKRYATFGRNIRDLLQGTMRVSGERDGSTGDMAMFFDLFGVQADKGGTRVRVLLVAEERREEYWVPRVEADGEVMLSSEKWMADTQVQIDDMCHIMTVRTRENEFKLKPVKLFSKKRHHLNVAICRLTMTTQSELYMGVLWFALNSKRGTQIKNAWTSHREMLCRLRRALEREREREM